LWCDRPGARGILENPSESGGLRVGLKVGYCAIHTRELTELPREHICGQTAMTYEYVCTACHHEWEESQSISAAPLTDCPKCHDKTAKRQISGGTGFVLKGGGWYSDLYSSAKPKAASSEGGAGESKSDSSTKSDSSAKTDSSTKSDSSTASSSSSS
jgi:putative FmdB family regulatory protein